MTRCTPPPSLPLVSLKDLREGGNCQDGSSGSKEVMNVLVRVFWQPERFGASRPVGRFMFPLASSLPFLAGKGAEGPTSPRKHTPRSSGWPLLRGRPSLSLSLVGSDPGQSAPRPPYARPAGPRVERKRRELPAPALGSGHWSGRGVRGAGRSGGEESQGPGRRGEPGTPVTWAAPPREALGRAGAKHKQTHARPPPARPPLCGWGLQAAH